MTEQRYSLLRAQALSGLFLGSAVGVAVGRPDTKLIGGIVGALIGPIVMTAAGSAGYDAGASDRNGRLSSGHLSSPRFL